MTGPGGGFRELEAAVAAAADEIIRLRAAIHEAEGRGTELERLLRRFQVGDEHPAAMRARLNRLEAENRDLHERIEKGREGVERLLARIRFLEGQQP